MASEILKTTEDKMKKALDAFQDELKSIRTGRPNPEIFKRVRVECYGTSMALSDLASISVVEGRSFLIQPFDKSNLRAIDQGIQNSDLGLTPSNDGSVIRINVPPLTEERRKDLIKQVSKLGEEKGRLSVRNLRRDAKTMIEKQKGTISEDELKKELEALEKVATNYINKIDEVIEHKEQELKTV
ncbi:MAG: ribosome recycling factor [Candidatus Caenarcaniphilales bacterium]|nr:ribosome recycling factor [Candidatus Caenarcaniphilales bacterium]